MRQEKFEIACNKCGAVMTGGSGKFLRPVLVLCGDCKRTQTWHPAPKREESLDKSVKKAENT